MGCVRRSAYIDRRRRITQTSGCGAGRDLCDAEGAVWVADAAHSWLLRVAEVGTIIEEPKTDGVGVFACMLGGDGGCTLFASVAPTFHEAEASANHQASVLMTKVEVPHAGLP